MSDRLVFPTYSQGERLADAVVHLLALAASLAGAVVLLLLATGVLDAPPVAGLKIASLAIYGLGLVTIFATSTAYHLATRPGIKETLRRLDHAAIYIMIAGSYTPFALVAVGGAWGIALLSAVWALALIGVLLKLFRPRRFERVSLVLYLLQGWAILTAIEPLVESVPTSAFVLLAIGGGLYTFGVVFHLWKSLPYHNVVWHCFVVAAASCHYVAILEGVALA